MPVDKLPLTQADLHEHDASQSADQLVQSHHQDQVKAPVTWQLKFLKGVASNLHYVTFLPLIIISILQDINIVAAAAACTSLVLLLIFTSFCCYRAGFVKVFPKPFDLFNLSLYGSMIPLSLRAHDWLLMYVGLLTNGGNAAFMWATILLPCCDNFVMHSVRDRLPPEAVNTPLARRMALLIALTWATALTLMTAGASIPIAVKLHPTWPHPGNIVASYVLGFGPLLMALPIQLAIAHVYKKKLIAQFQQQQQQHGVSSGSPAARDQEAL